MLEQDVTSCPVRLMAGRNCLCKVRAMTKLEAAEWTRMVNSDATTICVARDALSCSLTDRQQPRPIFSVTTDEACVEVLQLIELQADTAESLQQCPRLEFFGRQFEKEP